jgi:hypothetical protein
VLGIVPVKTVGATPCAVDQANTFTLMSGVHVALPQRMDDHHQDRCTQGGGVRRGLWRAHTIALVAHALDAKRYSNNQWTGTKIHQDDDFFSKLFR